MSLNAAIYIRLWSIFHGPLTLLVFRSVSRQLSVELQWYSQKVQFKVKHLLDNLYCLLTILVRKISQKPLITRAGMIEKMMTLSSLGAKGNNNLKTDMCLHTFGLGFALSSLNTELIPLRVHVTTIDNNNGGWDTDDTKGWQFNCS